MSKYDEMNHPEFIYAGRSGDGKLTQGRLHAVSAEIVIEHLLSRGLTPIEVKPSRGTLPRLRLQNGIGRNRAIMLFLRSLSTLLGVGITLRRALHISMEECGNADLREALDCVSSALESGTALATALRGRSDMFSPMLIALVEAGERGGALVETLERYADSLDRSQALTRKLLSTLTYPALVLVTALILVVVLIVSILPTFAGLFIQLRVDPPWTMQLLLGISRALTGPTAPLTLASIVSLVFAAVMCSRRSPACIAFFDDLRLRLPVVGSLLHKSTVSYMSRTLGTLLRAGVSLPEALEITIPVLGFHRYRHALVQAIAVLRDGMALSTGLRAAALFDGLVLHLVTIGEETGTIDAQWMHIAEYYERSFEQESTRAAALVEPLLIAGIGAIVGFIVFSVFVPLYGLVGEIK